MELKEKLTNDMKEAMKSGDSERLSVIRLLRSSIKNKEIDKGKGISLTNEEVLQVIVSAVKQRKEAIDLFTQGNRSDLIEKERNELSILESFLPQPISDEALKERVDAAIAESKATDIKQMGEVMKVLMPRIVGVADGKKVSEMVRSRLGARPPA